MYGSPQDMLRAFRELKKDTVAPYFWTEPEIFRYMTEAEAAVARATLCIQDMTSEACIYDVAENEPNVRLHPSFIRIRSARWMQDGVEYPLEVLSMDTMVSEGYRIYTQKGRPSVLMVGTQTEGIRLYPIPHQDGQLAIAIYRAPLLPITNDSTFEVPEQYRPAIFEYLCYRAMMKNDAEVFDRARASDHMRAYQDMIDQYQTTEGQRWRGPQSGRVAYGGL